MFNISLIHCFNSAQVLLFSTRRRQLDERVRDRRKRSREITEDSQNGSATGGVLQTRRRGRCDSLELCQRRHVAIAGHQTRQRQARRGADRRRRNPLDD